MDIKVLNIKYSLIQILYCMVICAMTGFATVFLLDKGFSNSIIGTVLALSNILAIITQQMTASLIERFSLTLPRLIAVFCLMIVGMSAVLLVLPPHSNLLLMCLVIIYTLMISLTPFINSLIFEFEKIGMPINFGLARGLGSASYAMTSLVLGNVIGRYSPSILPYLYVILSIMMFIVILLFKVPKPTTETKVKHKEKQLSLIEFVKTYKMFMVILVATVLLLFDQNVVGTFFIQIIQNVGGDSSNLGTAMFIGAMVELPTMLFFYKIQRKFNGYQLMNVAAIFFSIKHILIWVAPNIYVLYLAQVLQCLGFALFVPTSIYMVQMIVKQNDLIKGQALMTGAMTMGGVLATFTGGILLDALGIQHTLLVGAIISVLGTFLMLYGVNQQEKG